MAFKDQMWRYAASGSLLALLIGADAASAQTTHSAIAAPVAPTTDATQQSGGANVLQDIIVTAQKRSERINDVPLSITAATGAALAQAGVTDTSQLTKIVPGFTYQLSTYGTPVFGIRGISFYDTSGVSQPAVSIYVDQVPLPLSILARGASLDIERVEVLKGPQGTLFGQNSTGGAINYIAARPTNHFAAGGDILFGRFNQAEFGGYVSGPLSNTVSARLALRTEQRDDWQYSKSRSDDLGQRNFIEGRLLLDWNPVDSVRFELNVNGWKDRSDAQAAQFVRFAPANATPASPTNPTGGYPPAFIAMNAYTANFGPATANARQADWDQGLNLRNNNRFFQTSLRGEWDATDQLTLTSLSSYITYKGYLPTDLDGTSYAGQQNLLTDDINVFSQEVRASLTAGPAKLLAGGYYEYDKYDEDLFGQLQTTNSLLAGSHNDSVQIINHQRVNTYAGFGGVDLDLGHGIKLQGSGRYTKQNRSYQGCVADGGDGGFSTAFTRISTMFSGSVTPPIAPGTCIELNNVTFKPAGLLNQSLNQDNFSWRAIASWQPSRGMLFYVNATKGYKAGGFSTVAGALTTQFKPVVQESVQSYEAGFKLTLAPGLQFDGAGFHYDYTNKQIVGYVQNPPFSNLPTLINVPKSKIDGAELSLVWQPMPALRLSGSGTYVNARVSDTYLTIDPFAAPININGERLPATPRWQGNADAEYRFNPGGRLQPYVGASLAYQSSSYAAFGRNAEFKLPSRTLLDLRAGVEGEGGKWRVEAFGRNVTNRYYWVTVSHTTDSVTRLAGMPATYGLRATFRY